MVECGPKCMIYREAVIRLQWQAPKTLRDAWQVSMKRQEG